MTVPPPPKYAPSVGLPTTWWTQASAATADAAQGRLAQSMDELSRTITETPDERKRRLREEDDTARAAAGETPKQRAQRHQAEDRTERDRAKRANTRAWKAAPSERARRFRRWCTLTAASASAGYSLGLVQLISTMPALVAGLFALPAAYWLDLSARGGWHNAIRLSDLRGWHQWRRITAVLIARIPVASVLASLLHLDQLLAATGQLFH